MSTPKLFSLVFRALFLLLIGGLFLLIPVAWRSDSSLPEAILDCPAEASGIDLFSSVQSACGLGSR